MHTESVGCRKYCNVLWELKCLNTFAASLNSNIRHVFFWASSSEFSILELFVCAYGASQHTMGSFSCRSILLIVTHTRAIPR